MKKILIICGGLGAGGVEQFAINIQKYAPEKEFSFDYLLFNECESKMIYDIEKSKSRILTIASPHKGYINYIRSLYRIMNENKYDVVHSHTQFNSGINVLIAKYCNIPIRITHSHTTCHETKQPFSRQVYEKIMRKSIENNATHYCSCGNDAGKWMYGNNKFIVINNGIDTTQYAYSNKYRAEIRLKYGIPQHSFVVGNVGSLSIVKNQEYLINMVKTIKKEKDTYLLLVGDNNENYYDYLIRLVEKYELSDRVIFAGATAEAYKYYSAFDVFVSPSLREGTPISVIEAQANGLPCILNDVIPKDVSITDLVKYVSIYDNDMFNNCVCFAKRNDPSKYYKKVENKGYGVNSSMKRLYDIYRGKV